MRKFFLTTESPLEPLHKPTSPILPDVIINDSEDELIIIEVDPDRRPGAIEFILGQSFCNREHFCNALKSLPS